MRITKVTGVDWIHEAYYFCSYHPAVVATFGDSFLCFESLDDYQDWRAGKKQLKEPCAQNIIDVE